MSESIESRVLHGRYKIQRQLAKKAARRVLLARDLETQELVVVKLLLFGSEFEWQDYKLFERGAQALQALSHPSIPRYLDYFELDLPEFKGFALVQTYIQAKSLQGHLKVGRTFSEAEVKQLAKALLEILTYLHDRQPPVIHRDIKPSNILLGNRSGNSVGQVYLVDFDSVQTAARESGTITIVGTYGYMPPEQFGGRAFPASDLYGLGATLIYLVTGRDPADLPQIDLQIQFEQVANLSPTFTRWLKQMTQPSLDKRLSSAQEALQALEKPHLSLKDTVHIDSARPESSRIVLHKDANHLEIFIPAVEWRVESFYLRDYDFGYMLGGILFSIPIVIFFVGGIEFLPFLIVFGLPFFLAGLYLMYPLLSGLILAGKSIRIDITPQEIYFTRKIWLWGITRTAKRQNITKLLVRVISSDTNFLIFKIITIQTREQIFNIDQNPTFTDEELHWLTDELSQWLNLPITKA